MSLGLVRVVLVLASLAAIPAGLAVYRMPLGATTPATVNRVLPAAEVSSTSGDSIEPLLRRAAALAPFRADRRAARVAYDVTAADEPPVAVPPATPKPTLMLSGIVWGGDPAAVLEGLPGADGPRAVRRRDRIGALTIRGIERDRVIVTGLDTTWTLRVREPWK
jgi:hypothetical protein